MKSSAVRSFRPVGIEITHPISSRIFYLLLIFSFLATIVLPRTLWADAPGNRNSVRSQLRTGNLYAVVVGLSKFRDRRIPQLDRAARDAVAFGGFLQTQKKVFKKIQVTYLIDEKASKAEIEKHLYYTLPKAGKEDSIILFFSGHGSYDPMRPKEFLFLAYDSDPDYLSTTAVKMAGLDFLRGIEAERVLIVADACHAGGFSQMKAKSLSPSLKLFLKEVSNSSGRAIITSGKEEQLSWELPGLKNSVFTHNLLEGLKGKADRDFDGIVTLNEAYRYAYRQTRTRTKGHQHPQFEGRIVGNFPLSYVGPATKPAELKKRILEAARKGNVDEIERLIQAGASAEARDHNNDTPLIASARNGRSEAVKLLLSKPVDVNAANNQGNTALTAACRNGHTEAAKLLVRARARVNLKNGQGRNALAEACNNGHIDVARFLLLQGADIKARTKDGWTALHLAAATGKVDLVKHLLRWGCDIEARDMAGATALIQAVRRGHAKAVELLLEKKAGVSVSSGGLREKHLVIAVLRDRLPEVENVLRRGANVNAKTVSGDTPLSLAASLGRIKMLKYLISKGADVNVPMSNGMTPLMLAASEGRRPELQALLTPRARVDAKDQGGNTALILAARNGHAEAVKMLLAAHAFVNAQNARGRTALMEAAGKGHSGTARALLAADANVDIRDRSGRTALMCACENGNLPEVRLLLSRNPDINARNKRGRTPLILAARNGHKAVVKFLTAKGADQGIEDWEGKTASTIVPEGGLKEPGNSPAHR